MIAVKSNPFYTQVEDNGSFTLRGALELVIVHSDGKKYEFKKDSLVSENKISEARMMVSPEMLQELITELQLHQKTLEGIRANADKINSLVKYVQEGQKK